MFIITTQSTQEKYEQQTNYKCRLVLDMGFSSFPHSPHRRWLILSHSYLRALKLSALSIKVTFNMWIFGLSHKILELSFQRYKKTLRRYSRTLFFRRFCGKLIFCVYIKILLEGLKYSFYRRKEGYYVVVVFRQGSGNLEDFVLCHVCGCEPRLNTDFDELDSQPAPARSNKTQNHSEAARRL